ncbi:MAG: PQQ-dependent sugar dehydrogenase [Acidobacteriota bacterium]
MFSQRNLSASLIAAGLLALLAASASEARRLVLTTIDTGVRFGLAITHAGDDRLFVTSKEGRVWIYRNGVQQPAPFLDIRDRVLFTGEDSSEQGLLTLAFHPNFQQNGFLYVAYTDRAGVGILSRFSVSGPNPDLASRGSERVLLRVEQPGPNHNLNHLAFGPDGYLYLSSGDGGYQPEPRCTPQEGGNLLGKILRLDVDQNIDQAPYHGIPASNPFVGVPGIRDEIWALGLRNPWRFSFDRLTGDLFIADVGHRRRDEVDFEPAGSPGGRNYGFKMMEGFSCRGSDANCGSPIPGCFDPAYTPPILDSAINDVDLCAVIGGHVYRGQRIPSLRGSYVVGDYCGATGLVTRGGGGWQREDLATNIEGLVAFGEDRDGEIYLIAEGTISRIDGLMDDQELAFGASEYTVDESAGVARVTVGRSGSSAGAASVRWSAEGESAESGLDFGPSSGTLLWGAGEAEDRTIEVPIFQDSLVEGDETLRLRLTDPEGSALGTPSEARLVIRDDDVGQNSCVASETTLCLHDGRFQLTMRWEDFAGNVGPGRPSPLDLGDSGLFWFFGERNLEILVKVLDACENNDRYWVFVAGTTNVGWNLRVVDTQTGASREYSNGLGVNSAAVTDTDAFSACR